MSRVILEFVLFWQMPTSSNRESGEVDSKGGARSGKTSYGLSDRYLYVIWVAASA